MIVGSYDLDSLEVESLPSSKVDLTLLESTLYPQ